MANAADNIDGKLVVMSISTNLDTPSYKSVVCKVDNGLAGTRNVQTVETACGTAKAGGSPNYTVTGSLAANTNPGGTEMSADDLIALFESGDDFLFKLDDGADYYRQGQGFFSAYNETANTGDVVRADYTIEVKGSVDSTR